MKKQTKSPAKKVSKPKVSNKSIAIGAGITALAAAATGVYFMTGKNAKNRKKVTKWAKDVQSEVVKDLNKVGKASKSAYHKSVDTVVKGYKDVKNIDQADLLELAAELKSGWDGIKKQLDGAATEIKKSLPAIKKAVSKNATTKAVKKVVKKVSKTVAKKKVSKKK